MNVFVRILNLLPLLSSGDCLEEIVAKDVLNCKKLSFSCDFEEFSTLCEKNGEKHSSPQGLYSNCVEINSFFAKEAPLSVDFFTKSFDSGDLTPKKPKNAKEVVNSLSDFYKNYVLDSANPKLSIERLGVSLLIYDFFCERYGASPPPLCKSERGKPFFADLPLEISVSHADALVCCAFLEKSDCSKKSVSLESDASAEASLESDASAEISLESDASAEGSPFPFYLGLDAQQVPSEEKHNSLRGIAERFFKGDTFYAELLKSPSPKEFCDAFTLLWTKKESLVKMTGEGLGGIKKEPLFPYRQKSFSLFTDGKKRKYYISLSLNVPQEL